MKTNEFMGIEKMRSACYKLHAACFYQPDREMFLEEDLIGNLAEVISTVCPSAEAYATAMKQAFVAGAAEDLCVAHAKLFLGPFELQAPPYGSVYLEPGNRLMGNTTTSVMRLYQRAGLSLDQEFKDVPDHIAVELEFMHYLCEQELMSLASSDESGALDSLRIQHEFQDKYLIKWVPGFCARIEENSDNDFYVLLARCLNTFIKNTPVPGLLPDMDYAVP